ncbi:hypothetical protein ACRHK7_05790 [Weissella tructae]|uniref:Uncharacterized protein n=2 Tax=Weissella TaxID=46255 RepID=A0A075TZC9_9LACO|nr:MULTISPECIES: hypothetical protein [Weissella]AIG65645.1 hypothetical protein WS08_0706 [Weissella tructae]AIM62960.1 hypothetical protein WS74_0708 [Weissella ceti]ELA06901.1 hypothetical protein WCNC_04957 [Weissella ceti NC36]QVV90767.1 hypothetical protein KHQ32_03790 [Weissella tructae]
MSVLLVIILIFLAIGLYVRYKARTMMARLREQITVYGPDGMPQGRTKVNNKNVFDGQFEEVKTTTRD